MSLNPQIQQFLQQLEQIGLPSLSELQPARARELNVRLRGKTLRLQTAIDVENLTISGVAGDISIRVYKGKSGTLKAVLVYFHGGG